MPVKSHDDTCDRLRRPGTRATSPPLEPKAEVNTQRASIRREPPSTRAFVVVLLCIRALCSCWLRLRCWVWGVAPRAPSRCAAGDTPPRLGGRGWNSGRNQRYAYNNFDVFSLLHSHLRCVASTCSGPTAKLISRADSSPQQGAQHGGEVMGRGGREGGGGGRGRGEDVFRVAHSSARASRPHRPFHPIKAAGQAARREERRSSVDSQPIALCCRLLGHDT